MFVVAMAAKVGLFSISALRMGAGRMATKMLRSKTQSTSPQTETKTVHHAMILRNLSMSRSSDVK